MIHHKKTKIVATLGPACNTKEILKEMILAGVNVFRVNFSHAVYDEITEKIRMIRELNNELDFNVAILADLQGPKLRVEKWKMASNSAKVISSLLPLKSV
jgi:pyruvate kinase